MAPYLRIGCHGGVSCSRQGQVPAVPVAGPRPLGTVFQPSGLSVPSWASNRRPGKRSRLANVKVASLGSSWNQDDGRSEWLLPGAVDPDRDLDKEWQTFIRPRQSQMRHPEVDGWPPQDGPAVHSLDDWDFTEELVKSTTTSASLQDQGVEKDLTLWSLSSLPGVDMFQKRGRWDHLNEVYVILFGVGGRDTEGIYSLRAMVDEGLPQETIIAFEAAEDATRYASLLDATMGYAPSVCNIPPQELLDFCSDAGYNCRLEPKGSLLIPPDYNVGVTDWERYRRLREGHFSVLDEEPDRSCVKTVPSAPTKSLDLEQLRRSPTSLYAKFSEYTQAELDSIRARLEMLLPDDSTDDVAA